MYYVIYDNLEDDYMIVREDRKLDRYEFILYGPASYDECWDLFYEICCIQSDDYESEDNYG